MIGPKTAIWSSMKLKTCRGLKPAAARLALSAVWLRVAKPLVAFQIRLGERTTSAAAINSHAGDRKDCFAHVAVEHGGEHRTREKIDRGVLSQHGKADDRAGEGAVDRGRLLPHSPQEVERRRPGGQ